MRLSKWMEREGVTAAQFAADLGASRDGVHKWMQRQRVPRPEHLRKIYDYTKGAVTPTDFVELGAKGKWKKKRTSTRR
jgi:transcriptional regulator with XRE-family HTH domain